MGSSQIRDWTRVSCIGRWILIHCATRGIPASTYFNHDPFHDPALLWASWKGRGDKRSPVLCHADFSPLTNKIRLSKFEDPIGFTQRFMSWAESHAVTRRILQEAVQKCKAFTCRRRVGQGSYQERWKITRTVSGDLPLGEGQESMMQGAGVRGEGPGDRLPHWFLPENSRLAH